MIAHALLRKIARRTGYALVRASDSPISDERGEGIAMLATRETYARTGFDSRETLVVLLTAVINHAKLIHVSRAALVEMVQRCYPPERAQPFDWSKYSFELDPDSGSTW